MDVLTAPQTVPVLVGEPRLAGLVEGRQALL